MEAAGGAAGADGDGDGFEEAGGDEAGGSAVEVEERVGGLAAVEAALVAELDDRVGEAGALLWGVDLLVTAVSASQPQSGSSCSTASRRRWRSGPISLGSVTSSEKSTLGRSDEPLPEVVERAVRQARRGRVSLAGRARRGERGRAGPRRGRAAVRSSVWSCGPSRTGRARCVRVRAPGPPVLDCRGRVASVAVRTGCSVRLGLGELPCKWAVS